ncbi:MAG TPA: molecular chaperone [Sphingopyxis sp.]|nr:molecular chaperone [Sphingopyxis sp.]
MVSDGSSNGLKLSRRSIRRLMNRAVLSMTAILSTVVLANQAGAQQPGSLLIWPINPIIESDARAAALWLENKGKASATLQIRIYAWAQQDGDNRYAEQSEVIGTPPIVTIEAGQRQLVRLTRMTPPSDMAEASYRIIVDEIPTSDAAEAPGAAIRFRMRYSLPLFAYGNRAVPPTTELAWRMGHHDDGRFLEIRNHGTGHAKLTKLRFSSGVREAAVGKAFLGYILPGATMRWPLPYEADGTEELVATVNGKDDIVIGRQ